MTLLIKQVRHGVSSLSRAPAQEASTPAQFWCQEELKLRNDAMQLLLFSGCSRTPISPSFVVHCRIANGRVDDGGATLPCLATQVTRRSVKDAARLSARPRCLSDNWGARRRGRPKLSNMNWYVGKVSVACDGVVKSEADCRPQESARTRGKRRQVGAPSRADPSITGIGYRGAVLGDQGQNGRRVASWLSAVHSVIPTLSVLCRSHSVRTRLVVPEY